MKEKIKNSSKINICLKRDLNRWKNLKLGIDKEIWFCGYTFYNKKFYSTEAMCQYLKKTLTTLKKKEETFCFLRKMILELNGNLALIYRDHSKIFAAVDRLRSIPLFYAFEKGVFYISNDAHRLKRELSFAEIDPVSKQEFIASKYVSGEKTLIREIKQIQAGELLVVNNKNARLKIDRERYYNFNKKTDYKNQENIFKKIDSISDSVFRRLVVSVRNSPIVIPLSGGYDSRYIATMLKKMNYNNVICFSYGKKGNKESEVSKKVANALGFKWFFVEYSYKEWYKWFSSEQRKGFQRFTENLCSVMHIQDFLAVNKLKKIS
jgi:asparagine synthase (glutamine-hydrolysing)